MSKYANLTSHLNALPAHQWKAQFSEIEAILGFSLPKSAYAYPAWWSNQAADGHSQSGSWQSIGWRTSDLDLATQHVTFVRNDDRRERTVAADPGARQPPRDGLTIAEAKRRLAIHFGVEPENVEITIKG